MTKEEKFKERANRICRGFSSRYEADLAACDQLEDETYEVLYRLYINLADTFAAFIEAACALLSIPGGGQTAKCEDPSDPGNREEGPVAFREGERNTVLPPQEDKDGHFD